jgi:ABC-type branched-subunit amino acid transport system substrate-binding protein
MLLAGCAPTPSPVSPPRPVPDVPVHSDFEFAEQAFTNGQYVQALDSYNLFLKNEYDDPLAATALFRVGRLYRLLGHDSDALSVFLRLTHEFPQSPLVPDATLEMLTILFEAQDYDAVVVDGLAYSATTDPDLQRTPFYLLVADAYAAMGSYLDAARFYYRAWNTADDADAQTAWSKLKDTAALLGPEDLQQLIADVSDRDLMGFLLYRLGMAFIMDENYDEALDVLDVFVERFPDHPDHPDASGMVLSLIERARFTPFSVGCVLPLSGPYAIFGQRALNGIELALNQIAQGGDGIPYTIIVKDSRSDAGATTQAVDELDQKRVGAILGPMSAAETAAANANTRGIPILVLTQRIGVADIGPYVLRNFITPQMQVRSLVSFAVEELGARRFAILYPDENYGWRYMNLFWDQVITHGGVVNAVEPYDPDGTDFAEPIKKLAGLFYDIPKDLDRQSKTRVPIALPDLIFQSVPENRELLVDPLERISGIPLERKSIDAIVRRNPGRDDQWHPKVDFDAVFIPDAPKKAGLVIPQLAYYDIRDVHLLGTNLWNSKALLQMSGDYMKDTLITDAFFAQSQSEAVKQFVSDFQNAYDNTPGIIEALAYDSAMMVFKTMRETATDSRRDLKEALLGIDDFEGVSGRTGFAANGEAQKEFQMIRIKRGRFVQVQRQPDSETGTEVN